MKCDYYAIDFETANDSLDSACSIGIVGVKDSQVMVREHYYFHPHQNFSEFNISIHHITPEMVYGLDDFSKVWPKIYMYFDNSTIVCHNASFDMSVLKALIERYHLKNPNVEFFCTYKLSKAIWGYEDGFVNHKLDTLARYLDIDFSHHDALDDAYVCAMVANRILRVEQSATLKEASRKLQIMPGIYNSSRYYQTFKEDIPLNISNNRFLDKVFYFSGNSPFKKNLINEVKKCGGIVEKTFRDNCDYFVYFEGCDKVKLSIAKRKSYIKVLDEQGVLILLYDN